MPDKPAGPEDSYDRVAGEYAAEFLDELDRKPFDREVLDRFAALVAGKGVVCDLGCGPGHVARYLNDRGVEVRGIDISAEMINQARRVHPGIRFDRGDMLDLPVDDESLAGIICFYAIIHLRREDVARALQQMNRVLLPEGRLLISFHGGDGMLHRAEWYGKPVDIDVNLYTPAEMSRHLRDVGFVVDKIEERPPYAFEYQTRRLYAYARKSQGSAG